MCAIEMIPLNVVCMNIYSLLLLNRGKESFILSHNMMEETKGSQLYVLLLQSGPYMIHGRWF